jgi:hypothetical protein
MISETADPPVVKVTSASPLPACLIACVLCYAMLYAMRCDTEDERERESVCVCVCVSLIPTLLVPPHSQIIDYGKFKYSQEKKKKEQKKKAKTTEVKEVKMSYKIENHDYGVRMKQVRCGAVRAMPACCTVFFGCCCCCLVWPFIIHAQLAGRAWLEEADAYIHTCTHSLPPPPPPPPR